MNKKKLRERYLKIRKNISQAEKQEYDIKIFNRVTNSDEYKNCKIVLTYASLKDEVDTFKLIEYSLKQGKKVALPKCEGTDIIFYFINFLEELKKGSYGILEPDNKNIVEDFKGSICIIPGVCFDKEQNRVGYGKGYYDRFLSNYKGIKIGLAYKECICDKIDVEENDVKMDKIITC